MAGSTYPFNFFASTNSQIAVVGAGNSADTIKAGQLLLLDRNLNVITAGTASQDLGTLHVVYAKVDGQPIVSAPIPTANIHTPISITKYRPFVGFTYTLTAQQLVDRYDTNPKATDTSVSIRIIRTDNYTSSINAGSGLTNVQYKNTLASAQDAIKRIAKQFNNRYGGSQNQTDSGTFTATADAAGNTLTIASVPPALTEVGSIMTPIIEAFAIFDHDREAGIKLLSTGTFDFGAGSGMQVAELEQIADVYQQQNRQNGASPASFDYYVDKKGFYNTIGIRWTANYQADMGDVNQRVLSVSAAFATAANAGITPLMQDFLDALLLAVPKAHNFSDADSTDLVEDLSGAGNVANGANSQVD